MEESYPNDILKGMKFIYFKLKDKIKESIGDYMVLEGSLVLKRGKTQHGQVNMVVKLLASTCQMIGKSGNICSDDEKCVIFSEIYQELLHWQLDFFLENSSLFLNGKRMGKRKRFMYGKTGFLSLSASFLSFNKFVLSPLEQENNTYNLYPWS